MHTNFECGVCCLLVLCHSRVRCNGPYTIYISKNGTCLSPVPTYRLGSWNG